MSVPLVSRIVSLVSPHPYLVESLGMLVVEEPDRPVFSENGLPGFHQAFHAIHDSDAK